MTTLLTVPDVRVEYGRRCRLNLYGAAFSARRESPFRRTYAAPSLAIGSIACIAMALITSSLPNTRHVGRAQRRADAPERLTGRTRFANDLLIPGALYARFVRSPYASAEIDAIDPSAALAIDGVVAVLTAHDLPVVDIAAAVQAREIVLALDRTQHVGQPVAVVLGETEAAALDGVDAVSVSYTP